MELNLKAPEGRDVFYRLCGDADVVLEGFRPGVVKRLAVDYETVKRINPRIVYCSITGYGQTGPYAQLPGHDINYLALTGISSLIGPRDGPPVIPYNFIGDYSGGTMYALSGILMALLVREKTGQGQYVDVAMADGAMSLMTGAMASYFGTGQVPARGSDLLTGGYACYSYYQAKDGKWLALGCAESWFHANLCKALGREDFIPDQYNDARQPEMFAFFRERLRTRTRDEWFEVLTKADVCVSKVNTLDEVPSDPHVRHRQMITRVRTPRGAEVSQVGVPFKLSASPGAVRTTSPKRGEHTHAVLRALGMSAGEIEGLRAKGAV